MGNMSHAGQVLLRSEDVKLVDQAAVKAGIPLEVLMESAGRAVADAIRLEHGVKSRVLVICGKGNNGGDGFVVARLLKQWGYPVRVWALPGAGSVGVNAVMRGAYQAWTRTPNELLEVTPERLADLENDVWPRVDVVVDAIFGSSFRAPLGTLEESLIRHLRHAHEDQGFTVWSVDVPSGIVADTLEPPGLVVRADRTVALSGWKPALLFAPAAEYAGRVTVADVGIPPWIAHEHASGEVADPNTIALPIRPRDAHKGTVGRVIVAGGLPRYPGAPALAVHGAFRAGAGLVMLVAPPGAGLQTPVEATRRTVQEWTRPNLEFLYTEKCDAVVAGMGMGLVDAGVLEFLAFLPSPVVLDADALHPALEPTLRERWHRHGLHVPDVVLTPHPGEAARLLGVEVKAITHDPLLAAHTLAERFHAVVVLKGGPSVVAHPERSGRVRVWVNTSGNPGMASGGMGDVLGGAIGALIGQGMDCAHAARAGVYLHGRAGDLAALKHGYGLSASDVANAIPRAWLETERGK